MLVLTSRGVSGANASLNQTADLAHPANTPVLISLIGDPGNSTAADRSSLRIDRGAEIKNNTDTNAASSSNASFTLQIGACGNNVLPHTGYIAEIVVLASIVSDAVRQRIEGYLAWKWGLQNALIAGHPFANRPPLIGA